MVGPGLEKVESRFCRFVKKTPNCNIFAILYDDNVLVIGKPNGILETKKAFKKLFYSQKPRSLLLLSWYEAGLVL